MAKKKQPKIRKVMVATPCLTGQVSAWYLDSIINSIKVCAVNGIEIFPVTLSSESILPMARNELLNIAYHSDIESVVFIDSDQAWDPFALLELINMKEDVVGLPVVSKTDEPGQYNVRIHDFDSLSPQENGLVKVHAVGTGFFKVSKKALEALWDSNPTVEFRGKNLKLMCEYTESGGKFVGEDICLCNKLKELGFDVWVYTKSTCAHVGEKLWFGDFSGFLNKVIKANRSNAPQ